MTNTILTQAEAALAHEEPLFADVGGDIAVSFEFFPPKTEKMDAQLWDAIRTLEPLDPQVRHEARTFFACGGRGYDIMGLSEEQVIADILSQFERYLLLSGSPTTSLLTRAPEHHGLGVPA